MVTLETEIMGFLKFTGSLRSPSESSRATHVRLNFPIDTAQGRLNSPIPLLIGARNGAELDSAFFRTRWSIARAERGPNGWRRDGCWGNGQGHRDRVRRRCVQIGTASGRAR